MKKNNSIYDEKGFIFLSKTILEWEWYTDSTVSRLFIHILLKANFKQKKWNGITIDTGELITSLDKLRVELQLSLQTIRTALKKLKNTGYISTRSTNKYTHIKLLESDVYTAFKFNLNKGATKETTIKQQSVNNQSTTTNKDKKEKELLERKEIFKKQIFQFQNQYSSEKLLNFYNYWTEENIQTRRLKFEDEKYWTLETRLEKWQDFTKEKKEKKLNLNR